MEHNTYLGQDIDRVSQVLKQRSSLVENSRQEGENLWKKYNETRQPSVKLAVALRGFFLAEGVAEEEHISYGQYLRSRIRPTMEYLITHEEIEKMEYLDSLVWIEAEQIESYISMAKENQKITALVWLMQLKEERCPFKDKDFTL